MKFFLINPDYMLYGDPPLGLASLAAYLKRECKNLDIRILDQLSEKEMIRRLIKNKPEVIGLSAVSQNYWKTVKIAKKIKRVLPKSLLLIGGVHITTSPKSFAKSPFDLAVRGEGEVPATKLFKMLIEEGKLNVPKLSKIPGFIIRTKKKVIDTGLSEQVKDLDKIPLPARELLNMPFYKLPRFSIGEKLDANGAIVTSRGCPYSCKFCSSSSFWGRRIRFFSAKRVVDEIKLLYKKYNYQSICIYDDLFSINKERLKEIVRLMGKEGLLGKLNFDALGRANCFDNETAMLLKKMGVSSVTFGFESGSQKVLDYLKGNNVTVEQGSKAVKTAKKHGLEPGGFFMVGAPTEAVEDIKKTYDFIKENKLDSAIVFQVTAFPGTACWEHALKNNVLKEDFYDTKQKDFVDINPDLLLSQDISKKEFVREYHRVKGLVKTKNPHIISKLNKIRPRHIISMLSIPFLRKARFLYKNFLKFI